MLQTVNTQGHAGWPTSIADPIVNQPEKSKRSIPGRGEADLQTPSAGDVALLYPEAVVASSDALAWQHIRLIHLRHSLNEMVVPPSDNHCIVLNLSAPMLLSARLDKHNFEGGMRAG